MGLVCCCCIAAWCFVKHKNKILNSPVDDEDGDFETGGVVHMVICSMDYKQTNNPLSCTKDGSNMTQLAQACGVTNLKVLTDEGRPLTKDMAMQAIEDIAAQCGDDDYFVFYYSGHGTQLAHQESDDRDEDREDKDDAYCFQDEKGQVSYNSCWDDDHFAAFLIDTIPEGARTVILSDCCHSDTIADLGKSQWADKQVVSISGCLDNQTSGDIGTGGIFTHSMLLAIDELSRDGEDEYSVAKLFNTTLDCKNLKFGRKGQQLAAEHSDAIELKNMAWPLVPQVRYVAPLNRQ